MSAKLDQPTAVRVGEELPLDRLNTWAVAQPWYEGDFVAVQQFPGGYSNLTYLLHTPQSQGYVLRRPPFGAEHIKGGHDIGREYRILSMLAAAGFTRIPRPVALCEETEVLGCTFYLMEQVKGVVIRSTTATSLGLSPTQWRGLSEALVDNLVELHAIDLADSGLMAIGKPEGYIERQVKGWYGRYQAAQTQDLPVLEAVYQWLVQHLPAALPPTLLHNDYKYDNLLLAPEDLTRVLALLDWEMCTVGDPRMDVGTALSYWTEATDPAFLKQFNPSWMAGNLSRKEFADRYATRSGRDLSAILYFYVFGLFKNSVVLQQIYGRWKRGYTQDPRFAALIQGIEALLSQASKAIESNHL